MSVDIGGLFPELEKDLKAYTRPFTTGILPAQISGKANPKSSTGRLDIFTRLITDYGTEFEGVPQGYKGPLYLEIVPRTFSVLVREGLRLNQLRLVRGNPASSPDAVLDEL